MPTKSSHCPTRRSCRHRQGLGERDSPALAQAMALAEKNGAHLSVTLAAQEVVPPYSPVWDSMASAFVADLNEKTKAHAEKMAETLKRQTAMPGVTVRTRVYSTAIGSAAASAVMAARACDLIVVDQPTAAMDTRGSFSEEALFPFRPTGAGGDTAQGAAGQLPPGRDRLGRVGPCGAGCRRCARYPAGSRGARRRLRVRREVAGQGASGCRCRAAFCPQGLRGDAGRISRSRITRWVSRSTSMRWRPMPTSS